MESSPCSSMGSQKEQTFIRCVASLLVVVGILSQFLKTSSEEKKTKETNKLKMKDLHLTRLANICFKILQ